MSRRPARHRPPSCPICGQLLALETVAYQPTATPDWDYDLERTQLISADRDRPDDQLTKGAITALIGWCYLIIRR